MKQRIDYRLTPKGEPSQGDDVSLKSVSPGAELTSPATTGRLAPSRLGRRQFLGRQDEGSTAMQARQCRSQQLTATFAIGAVDLDHL